MSEPDLIGQTILERYHVLSRLGEGAMGSVYLANDVQLQRQVALKVLRKEWVSRAEVRKRLENECRLMAHLGPHTNIVTLYDRIIHDDNVVLVLEFVPGEPLSEVLERTRNANADSQAARKTAPIHAGGASIILGPRDSIGVVLQCLAALDFAHSKGILHRDIKPGNIMISRDHNGNIVAKVMDFGIGKALAEETGGMAAMTSLTMAGGPGPGTPAYMAPEQIDPARYGPLGPGSDLYALGITLFEMLTLRLPFEGTYTELLHAHTNVEPPDARKISPKMVTADVQRVLVKALRKETRNRYQSASEFRADLSAAGGGGGTIVGAGYTPASISGNRRSSGAKNRLIPAVLTLVVLLSGGGGGWYFFKSQQQVSAPTSVPSSTSSSPSSAPAPPPETPPVSTPAPAPILEPIQPQPAPSTGGDPSAPPPSPEAPPSAAPVMANPFAATGQAALPPPAPIVPASDPAAPPVPVPDQNSPPPPPPVPTVTKDDVARALEAAERARRSALDRNEDAETSSSSYKNGLAMQTEAKRLLDAGDLAGAQKATTDAKSSFAKVPKPKPTPVPEPTPAPKPPPGPSAPPEVAALKGSVTSLIDQKMREGKMGEKAYKDASSKKFQADKAFSQGQYDSARELYDQAKGLLSAF